LRVGDTAEAITGLDLIARAGHGSAVALIATDKVLIEEVPIVVACALRRVAVEPLVEAPLGRQAVITGEAVNVLDIHSAHMATRARQAEVGVSNAVRAVGGELARLFGARLGAPLSRVEVIGVEGDTFIRAEVAGPRRRGQEAVLIIALSVATGLRERLAGAVIEACLGAIERRITDAVFTPALGQARRAVTGGDLGPAARRLAISAIKGEERAVQGCVTVLVTQGRLGHAGLTVAASLTSGRAAVALIVVVKFAA